MLLEQDSEVSLSLIDGSRNSSRRSTSKASKMISLEVAPGLPGLPASKDGGAPAPNRPPGGSRQEEPISPSATLLHNSNTASTLPRRPSLEAVRECEVENHGEVKEHGSSTLPACTRIEPSAPTINQRKVPPANQSWAQRADRRSSEPVKCDGGSQLRRGSCGPLGQLRRGSDMMMAASRRCGISSANALSSGCSRRGSSVSTATKVVPLTSLPQGAVPPGGPVRRGTLGSRRTSIDMAANIMNDPCPLSVTPFMSRGASSAGADFPASAQCAPAKGTHPKRPSSDVNETAEDPSQSRQTASEESDDSSEDSMKKTSVSSPQ